MQLNFNKVLGLFSLALLGTSRVFSIQSQTNVCQSENCRTEESSDIAFQPCAGFSIAHGQATTSTLLWILGEKHNKRDVTANCVEELTHDLPQEMKDHIIYLEEATAGKVVSCKDHGIKEKPGRTCVGLEDTDSVKKFQDATINIRVKDHIANFQKFYQINKKSDKDFDKFLKGFIQNLENSKSTNLDVKGLKRAYKLVFENRKKGLSYKKIFSENEKKMLEPVDNSTIEAIQNATLNRNKKMIPQINNRKEGTFAIAIFGLAHVVPDESSKEFPAIDPAKYVEEELKKGPDQNRYALLAMN